MKAVDLWVEFTIRLLNSGNNICSISNIDFVVPEDLKELTPIELENYEERAAIMQYDGGLDKSLAESEALKLILKKRYMN